MQILRLRMGVNLRPANVALPTATAIFTSLFQRDATPHVGGSLSLSVYCTFYNTRDLSELG